MTATFLTSFGSALSWQICFCFIRWDFCFGLFPGVDMIEYRYRVEEMARTLRGSIRWYNDDWDIWHHVASVGHSELIQIHQRNFTFIYFKMVFFWIYTRPFLCFWWLSLVEFVDVTWWDGRVRDAEGYEPSFSQDILPRFPLKHQMVTTRKIWRQSQICWKISRLAHLVHQCLIENSSTLSRVLWKYIYVTD